MLRTFGLVVALAAVTSLGASGCGDDGGSSEESTDATDDTAPATGDGDTTGGGDTAVGFEAYVDDVSGLDNVDAYRAWAARLDEIDMAVFDGALGEEVAESDIDLVFITQNECVDYGDAAAVSATSLLEATTTDIEAYPGGLLRELDRDVAEVLIQIMAISMVYDPDLCPAITGQEIPADVQATVVPAYIDNQDPAFAEVLRTTYQL